MGRDVQNPPRVGAELEGEKKHRQESHGGRRQGSSDIASSTGCKKDSSSSNTEAAN